MDKKKSTDEAESQINIGTIKRRSIVEEMQEAYIDYAMSVIVARALPDVRDGFKPVHRRILYAMWTIGLKPGAKFRKSATVVGEVIGKYHPHGDAAIYDSLVRLAQDFSMRYPLIKGQGNFGSLDGDAAAAMRYTEAKLAPIAEEILTDIEKDTVDFVPNYDGAHKEPIVLPAKTPNLLINGSMGIAVGMATSIPPHHLGEIIDGVMHLIDHPQADIDDLMKYIHGPDFPTGGIMFNVQDIKTAYATGKGSVVTRAKAEIVEEKQGQFKIQVTEIPYQVNKASLLEKIAELVKTKKIDGIKDLRDESDKEGVRIVVELKKDAYPKKILNQLFKLTPLQTTFHFNMLALVDGIQPRVLSLKQFLEEFIKHRQIVVMRRARYDLVKAKERAHILEGLVLALEHIDRIIKTIKKSRDKEGAKKNLISHFKLTERQAVAILEMKLQQLANLERLKIEQELKEKKKLIKELESLLKSKKKVLEVIKSELTALKEKYADERRTKVIKGAVDAFSQEDLIPNETMVVVMTRDGYIKRIPPTAFKTQGRGGKGVRGLATKEEDFVEHLFATTTHTNILFFTNRGRVFQLKGYNLPQGTRTSKGQAIINFLQLAPQEKVTAALPMDDVGSAKFLVMITRLGQIKKVKTDAFENVRRSGLIALTLKNNDTLEWVRLSSGQDNVLLVTTQGQAIRFKEKNIRAMGRTAAGVRAIRLKKDDEVIGMDLVYSGKTNKGEQLLVVMKNGYGKRTALREYRLQGRGGSGIKTAKITKKTGPIVSSSIVNGKNEKQDLIIISDKGQVIRLPLTSISVLGRSTQGVKLMSFREKDDHVASVTFIEE